MNGFKEQYKQMFLLFHCLHMDWTPAVAKKIEEWVWADNL